MKIGSKVLVVGCSGSGKSTFARALGERTGLPVVHLDNLFWRGDGTHVSAEEFDRQLEEALSQDAWIMDGDFNRTYERRIAAADIVILLDYPEEVCLAGIAGRVGQVRPDIPWVERELDPALVAHVRAWRSKTRPRLLELLAKYPHKQVFVLRSREEASAWLKGL